MMAKHETCLEYFWRRLSEGWKYIEFRWPHAVLLSPDGIIRPVDLRNDTLTLVPNGAGDYKALTGNVGGGDNYDKVDDPPANPDDSVTYVFTTSTTQKKDAYNLQDTDQGGTINSVRVYFRIRNYLNP